MGPDKADVLVGDRTMLERVGSAVGSVTDRLVALSPDRAGWDAWPDSVHVQGPLAGIATALSRTAADRVLLVAVDHPFVSTQTLRQLVQKAGELPLVPVDDHGVRQVTCAVYPRSIADAATEEASQNGSIQSLLDRVSFDAVTADEWRSWGEDGRSWFSADDQSSLAEGLALYESEPERDQD